MKKFNIRVYGILTYNDMVLLSHEMIGGTLVTKFPGGGLEWGEGIMDCLKREMMEELDMEVADAQHFYTTDFFQQSAFNASDQVISVYYLVPVTTKEILSADENISVSWMKINELQETLLAFPIDRKVAKILSMMK